MLQSYWPYLVRSGILLSSTGTFEVTRACEDKTVHPSLRRTIFPELRCATQEFISLQEGSGMIGVNREHLLSHFIRSGIDWLGPTCEAEGEMERAFFAWTCLIRLVFHCERLGIPIQVPACGPETTVTRSAA